MHLLKFDPNAQTLTEVLVTELNADSSCTYFYVKSKRVELPIFTPDGWKEIVWQSPDWTPPPPILRRRPWIKRLFLAPGYVAKQINAGIPLLHAISKALLLIKP